MTAEQQLERSVLEGKERDELSAIAQAMSLKTTSRTKKADIIDQILDATGVTSGSRRVVATGTARGEPTVPPSRPAAPVQQPPARATTPRLPTVITAGAADDTGGDGRRPGPATDGTGAAAGTGAEAAASGEAAPATTTSAAAAGTGDAGPAVFVEPPELADGTDPGPRQNGQGQTQTQTQPGQPQPQTRTTRTSRQPGRRSRQPAQPPAPRPRARPERRAAGRRPGAALHGRAGRGEGLLDLRDEGYGFLRCEGYLPSPKDVYVSISQARAASRCAGATTSRAPAGRPRTTRSTRRCCASTRSRASTPRRRATGPASRT